MAGDSTGFESRHCSNYSTRRQKRTQNKGETDTPGKPSHTTFPKLGIVADCGSHMILSKVCGVGPRPDVDQVLPLMEGMTGEVVPDTTLWDAGYDSENNHELLREYLEIESIIPAKIGRPTNKLPKGKWRWLMATAFDEETYGQRWQVETVMHMLKSRLGESLTARSDAARNREMGLMVLTHNLMVVLCLLVKRFLQSRISTLKSSSEKGISMLCRNPPNSTA